MPVYSNYCKRCGRFVTGGEMGPRGCNRCGSTNFGYVDFLDEGKREMREALEIAWRDQHPEPEPRQQSPARSRIGKGNPWLSLNFLVMYALLFLEAVVIVSGQTPSFLVLTILGVLVFWNARKLMRG